jgi:hypothetical protein
VCILNVKVCVEKSVCMRECVCVEKSVCERMCVEKSVCVCIRKVYEKLVKIREYCVGVSVETKVHFVRSV